MSDHQPVDAGAGADPDRPKRIPHAAVVRELAVAAVKDLMSTGQVMTTAAETVAASTGAGVSSVVRWCRAAGVGPDEARAARDRQWQDRLDVVNRLNRELADAAREYTRTHLHGAEHG